MKKSNGKGTVFMMSNLDHYNGGAFADLKTALKSVCERLDSKQRGGNRTKERGLEHSYAQGHFNRHSAGVDDSQALDLFGAECRKLQAVSGGH